MIETSKTYTAYLADSTEANLLCFKQIRNLALTSIGESVSVRHLAKRFNIGKTQAAEIAKNKEDIRSKWQSGTNINQKKDFLKKEEG
ncbi:unnamed protein product [Acanthoscelides obtectus]|uniref:Uncharacterized protein n=1 Tax=Acanthoscelides obtectus TaxID=200917 RepID=A0A9P0Q3N1_ACAOB|nr:unnamed protein product [Acanthoscelides obtectus]CAK1655902.1 hypothetical protein AOBTE_LOCUS19426 [Acanthoscelides obtectus]